jgi:LysR family transcriptional regulator, glycine cleavage system transcriptional activator
MQATHPPIHLLKAFVCVAGRLNVSRAADDLHLTQSTVSKQILELERMLGIDLFQRVNNRLQLSAAGHTFLDPIQQVLQQLETATLNVMAQGHAGGVLRLSCLPTLAGKWLIPRLPDFAAQHPLISVELMPHRIGYDFSVPELDCAIRYGDGRWPGAQAIYLTGQHNTVIAPQPLPKGMKLKKPKDVAALTLLQHMAAPQAWQRWCAHFGVAHPAPGAGPKFDQVGPMVSAVVAGWGVALVPTCLVADDIKNGLVSAPLALDFVTESGYYFCYPPSKADLPTVKAFRQWLQTQAEPVAPI